MVSAQTPPMGWNSWDCFGTTVTETEVLANAQVMHDRLLPFGWDTIVVDIAWYDPAARAHGYNDDAPVVLDEYGRQLPAPNRFPSAVGGVGFEPLAARVHSLGLKFGLHVMRGIPRRSVELGLPVHGTAWTARDVVDREHVCAWNPDNFGLNHDHPGAQAYTTRRWRSSPRGEWTSSRRTTCWRRTTSARSRRTHARSNAAGGRSCCRCRRGRSCRRITWIICGRMRSCGGSPMTCGIAGRTCTRSSPGWRGGRRSSGPAAGRTRTCCRSATSASAPNAASTARAS